MAAWERLTVVSDELGDMIEPTTDPVGRRLDALSKEPAVVKYLRDRSPANEREVLQVIRGGRPAPRVIGTELRDAAGRRILATTSALPSVTGSLPSGIGRIANRRWAAIGELTVLGDSLAYPAVNPVMVGDRTLGHVIRWYRVATAEETLNQIREMIGPGAAVYLANTRGNLWTDLNHPIAGLPIDLEVSDGVIHLRRNSGEESLVAGVGVDRTPWTLVVEFPYDIVLAQPSAVMRWQITTGILLLLFGAAIAWVLTGRLTGSLAELAAAAGAISAGDYSRRVRVRGAEEIRCLGNAFNAMAADVESANRKTADQLHEIATAHARNRETTARLEHLIASSRAIIYSLRVTYSGSRLEWIGENVKSLLGYTVQEALRPGWSEEKIHPDDFALCSQRKIASRMRSSARNTASVTPTVIIDGFGMSRDVSSARKTAASR